MKEPENSLMYALLIRPLKSCKVFIQKFIEIDMPHEKLRKIFQFPIRKILMKYLSENQLNHMKENI